MSLLNAAAQATASLASASPDPESFPESFDDEALRARYRRVRQHTLDLVAPLSDEDMTPQSMPDASPAKWHLAHSSWFFETFVLDRFAEAHRPFDAEFRVLFNSYYQAVGPQPARDTRGLQTRPPVERVRRYRAHVDQAMARLMAAPLEPQARALIVLGLNHEEQHQELILTDLLHLFSCSPLLPAYDPDPPPVRSDPGELRWREHGGGLARIGRRGSAFAFDNEGPRHTTYLQPFRLADRLVTNGEWLAFMQAGGYADPALWLSEGFATAQAQGWRAPLYWREDEGGWSEFGFHGLRPLDPHGPLLHVSYYEADAYARWRGQRLPTEAEWEAAVTHEADDPDAVSLGALYDTAWQWTASAYAPYPGFAAAEGAVGEYNGKFMVNQMVLRGGAATTSPGHARATYRNFFHPDRRWQLTGVRLASDLPVEGDQLGAFRQDVLEGLSRPRKALPSKWLYDEAGSALFERITELPEYYPTRTELALLTDVAPEVGAQLPQDGVLVEFGSGSSRKTRLVLDAAPQLCAYVPIDISREALEPAAEAIADAYPALQVVPLRADFTRATALPDEVAGRRRVGFFPGSTIGNFTPADAKMFLRRARETLGEGALLLLGVDVRKSPNVLVAAYDDEQGVTAQFDLNILRRIDRELGGTFDLSAFAHRAVWNDVESRMEMQLESLRDQVVEVQGRRFVFACGETIHTENSYKYDVGALETLAQGSGWISVRRWTSPQPHTFALLLLQA